ncbi:nucleotide pyrophosphohydrolase [Bacillus thuringiensis]|uniref:nucleotide pyrophosphohydrolase n=1 Tax=Bacillus thuringiensis TaxID=1428 RepID=UPI003334F93C
MNQTILEKVLKFRDDRNWKQFHNPKDLAISLSLEASELLENFQWKSSEEAVETKKEDMKDELADVLIYSMLLADQLDIDLEEIIINKIEKNNKKYPVEKSRDSKKKYNEILKRPAVVCQLKNNTV